MKNIIFICLIGLLAFSSCEKIIMESNPKTSNTAIFNEYATLVKEKFAMLKFKGVDINFLQDSIVATIDNNTSQVELFEKLSIITKKLRDGHSDLSSKTNFAGYNFTKGYPLGFHAQILFDNYLYKSIAPNIKVINGGATGIKIAYGFMPQSNKIAYMWIPSWNIELSDDEIESVFVEIKNAKGLIIDMRTNTGGDPSLAVKFASYLTNNPVYTGFERFKTGPSVDDFSDSKIYLHETKSSNKFLKPVMVLIDRNCYSASTTFAYSVNPLDNITFIGQRTGGGSGSVADGYLANGWKWSLSTSEFIDHNNKHLDDGFDPDIKVALDTIDKTKDEVIERALIELQ